MLEMILEPANLYWFALVLILGAPLAAGAFAFVMARRGRNVTRSPFFWVSAASGPTVVVLWFAFNGILYGFGFDSIFSILANVLLFASIGAGIGAYLRKVFKKSRAAAAQQGRGRRALR